MKLSKLEPYLAVLLLVMVYVVSRQAGRMAAGVNVISGKERPVVVIDAGHGGNDPGKIGVDGSLEKDINLKIARKVKAYLEASDVQVVLTREDDQGLYTEKDSKKKMADMNRRCQIINETSPALTVSIHQNSYHDEEIFGGQVFYYADSAPGKRLAERIQKRFDYVLGAENRRQPKANESYYLLLHAECPAVIVECGFLSNWREASLLGDEEYQDRMAYTIHMGILEYLNGE